MSGMLSNNQIVTTLLGTDYGNNKFKWRCIH